MQAQRIRTLVRLPGHTPDWHWLQSPRARIAIGVARAAGQLLLATAATIIIGTVAGELFGVKHPANQRTPGGATPQDLKAFVAMAAVLIGLVISGWRMVPGSLISIAGAIAFWAAIPELNQTAFLLGAFGAANLTGWIVDRIQEHRHLHVDQAEPPHKQTHKHATPRHLIGLF
jgi:hypothetical protein